MKARMHRGEPCLVRREPLDLLDQFLASAPQPFENVGGHPQVVLRVLCGGVGHVSRRQRLHAVQKLLQSSLVQRMKISEMSEVFLRGPLAASSRYPMFGREAPDELLGPGREPAKTFEHGGEETGLASERPDS
jgi:hypothetical protein